MNDATRPRTKPTRWLLIVLVALGACAVLVAAYAYFVGGVRTSSERVVQTVTISVSWPGADAKAVDASVTEPIVELAKAAAGEGPVHARSQASLSTVVIEASTSEHAQRMAHEVHEGLSEALRKLPQDIAPPVVHRSEGVPPLLHYVVSSDRLTIAEVSRMHRERMITPLERVSGVGAIQPCGEREEIIEVLVSLSSVDKYGLSVSSVIKTIEDATVDESAILPGRQVGLAEGNGPPLADLALSQTVRLRDVAALSLRPERAIVCEAFAHDGTASLSVRVFGHASSADSIEDEVRKLAAALGERGASVRVFGKDDVIVTVEMDRPTSAGSSAERGRAGAQAAAAVTRDTGASYAWASQTADRLSIFAAVTRKAANAQGVKAIAASVTRALPSERMARVALPSQNAGVTERWFALPLTGADACSAEIASIRAALESEGSVLAFQIRGVSTSPELVLRTDRAKAAELGADPGDIARVLRVAVGGGAAGKGRIESASVPMPVHVRVEDEDAGQVPFDRLRVLTRSGAVPLSMFMAQTEILAPVEILRVGPARVAIIELTQLDESAPISEAWFRTRGGTPSCAVGVGSVGTFAPR